MGSTKPSSTGSGDDVKERDEPKTSPSRVEQGSSGEAEDPFEGYVVDRVMEKKILRKFDLIILPTLAIMYLMNSIDKSNLGNAETDGLSEDLNFVGNQYNILQTIFFVPFVLTGPAMNLLTKKYGAKYVLPAAMLIFGSMAMVCAACTNFGGIVAARWFLGMAESGFYPGVIFYLSTFYTKFELAGRLSIYYAASQIAGAFTGLLAFGVFQIQDSSLHGWQYLFIIEGALTFVVGLAAFWILPYSSATAYFLSEEEKKLAYYRIAWGSSVEPDAEFNFRIAITVFKTDRLWPLYMAIGMGIGVPLYSVANWLPQVVARFGFSTVKTNLYTVAPNVVGSTFLICVAFSSDYFQDRCLHLAGCLSITCIGFIILAAVDVTKDIAVGYFACFLLCLGGFITSPLLATWYTNNIPDENQRAILTPVLVSSANAMGLVSSNIFRDRDAPNYIPASVISASFGAVAAVLTLGVGFYMKFDNAKRNKAQGVSLKPGDVPLSKLRPPYQRDVNWRWFGGIK